jgi:hypothetical protein
MKNSTRLSRHTKPFRASRPSQLMFDTLCPLLFTQPCEGLRCGAERGLGGYQGRKMKRSTSLSTMQKDMASLEALVAEQERQGLLPLPSAPPHASCQALPRP